MQRVCGGGGVLKYNFMDLKSTTKVPGVELRLSGLPAITYPSGHLTSPSATIKPTSLCLHQRVCTGCAFLIQNSLSEIPHSLQGYLNIMFMFPGYLTQPEVTTHSILGASMFLLRL